uniref:Uncharacterized protein n=1 Tax=Oryza nivara TaxID=4536 RepID=A0A0E0G0T6_ORYNI
MAPGRFVTSSMEAFSKLLVCGHPPCRHRSNAPSAAGLPPPRCCCDSTEEFAAGRGFIRPRLGLGNLLVDVRLGLGNLLIDVEREGSDRRADTGPSPPRRCDFTEFMAMASPKRQWDTMIILCNHSPSD